METCANDSGPGAGTTNHGDAPAWGAAGRGDASALPWANGFSESVINMVGVKTWVTAAGAEHAMNKPMATSGERLADED